LRGEFDRDFVDPIEHIIAWHSIQQTSGAFADDWFEVLRCTSCLGGSMAMNIGRGKSSSGSNNTIDGSDEKRWWSVSTAMMSLYLVMDQYGPFKLSGQ
jgi:hypothetical protein